MSDPVVSPESQPSSPATPASPASPATPATPATPSFTYPEDRSAWVPQDRFKAAEAAVNRTARELAQRDAAIAEANRRIHALAGVAPVDPKQAEADEIAKAFYALPQFAHLKNVTPEMIDRLMALADSRDQITEAVNQRWDDHRDAMVGSAMTQIADLIGADELTDSQKEKIHAAFVAFGRRNADVFTDPGAGPYNSEFRKRYEARDPKLIAEFVQQFKDDFIEPTRRAAMAGVVRRAPHVPSGGGSRPLASVKQKPDLSKMSYDEMIAHAERESEEHFASR